MATKNSISMHDSNGKEIPDGATAPAGDVSFSGTTKSDEEVYVEVGDRKFSFSSPDGQLPVITIPLKAGRYTAQFHFVHLDEKQSRTFTLK
ncbi:MULTISPECIES: hypothetical protein [Pseudomonas]|uniref:hypothetical protein n=1 Tax=Pseudomonas sp. NFX71 TaxID=3399121 RepID=UPI003A87773E